MLNNKNGAIEFGLKHIGELILGLIVLGVLVVVIFMVLSPSLGIASDWTCKTSVALSSGTFGIAQKLNFDSIMCYTEEIKSDAKKKNEALNEIAEDMRKCWNMWGEGNLNPEGKNIWYGGEEKCFTCYKISFPELEESVSINDISTHLQEGEREHNKLKGEGSYWNYFKKSNPTNVVDVILRGKSENENENIIDKNKYYAVTYNENIEASTVGRLITSSAFGFGAGTVLCSIGVAAGFISLGTSTLLCIPALTATATITGLGDLGIRELWTKIQGKVPVDGIMFMDYKIASENCATVVKAGEEVKFEEVIKNG